MLKFFRKIRRRLLSEGSFRKYLLYALGEILLVMIGILLALQVNTWSENNKSKKEEAALLLELSKDVHSNILWIEETTQYDSMSIEAIDELFYIFENDLPYQDSIAAKLGSAFVYWPPVLTGSTMETIRAKGVDIIRSDSIRSQALALFDVGYNKLIEMYELDQNSNNIEEAYMLKYFRMAPSLGLVPNDYLFIREDPEILNILAKRRFLRMSSILFKKEVLEQSKKLLKSIEDYL